MERQLAQFEVVIEDQLWDEAIDLLEQLQLEHGAELVEAETDRYETVGTRCQRALCRLPPEGLQAYRRRTESSATREMQRGVQRYDEAALLRVATEMLASSKGAGAALALGEIALSAGDFSAARRWLTLATPEACGPYGEPLAVTLATLDPQADPTKLAATWRNAPRPTTTAAPTRPDDDSVVGKALTRLAVCSLHEGDTRRAALELRLLEALSPNIAGRLAGREQPIVPALRSMVREAQAANDADNDLPADSELVGPLNHWSWRISLLDASARNQLQARAQQQQRLRHMQQLAIIGQIPAEQLFPPRLSPALSAEQVVWVDGGRLHAHNLQDGKPLAMKIPEEWTNTANDLANNPADGRRGQARPAFRFGGGIVINGAGIQVRNNGFVTPRTTVTGAISWKGPAVLIDNTLYCRLYRQVIDDSTPRRRLVTTREFLVGLDLQRESKVVLELDGTALEEGNAWTFLAAPIVQGDRLYTFSSPASDRGSLWLGCFSRSTSQEIWRTRLGSCDVTGVSISDGSLVAAGDTLFVVPGGGGVVALSHQTGKIRWASNYATSNSSTLPRQAPSTPIVRGGMLFLAPADAADVYAFDTSTGQPVWCWPHTGGTPLLIPTQEALLVAGERLAWLDPLTGHELRSWPASRHAGLRGHGRAAVTADELFWPARNEIHCVSIRTGTPTRPPIPLGGFGGEGVDLYATPHGLLVLSSTAMVLIGTEPAEKEPLLSGERLKLSDSPLASAGLRP
ncbi:outer membrane protein assembly factor BamB family protein [Botrimarina hoheduenensis]|uniref:outer membrane protein assembly factor BamB family protein n=1 Tax=Botrimarina hoheduenensis TaxID=2528000 RepID=UPI0018D409A3|nr:PQQ-binding-like beta-propeller repeat protein [Botrimarina hoheduenensis]